MSFTKPTNDGYDYPTQIGRLVDIVEGPRGRNFIRNGDFQIAQRGTSFAGITTEQYTLDGWRAGAAGTSTVTQEAFSVDQTSVPGGPTNYLRLTRTVAAGADNEIISHRIEFPGRLAGKTVSVGFWARVSSGTKALVFDFGSSGITSAVNTSDNAFTATATWTFFSAVVTFSAMSGASASAYLSFRIREAASFGTFTLDVADVQLELGSEATYFERLGYLEQEQWCQRFFAKSFARATAPAQNVGNGTGEVVFIAGKAAATAEASPRIFFPVRMRAAPSAAVTLYNPAAANAQVRDQTAAADCSSSVVANITDQGFHVTATGNASTAVGNILGVHYAATAEL